MEGAQTDIGEGFGPPLTVGCDQSWASQGPPLTYMYIPGVQNFESMGGKSVTRGALHPHKMHSIPPLTRHNKNRKSSKSRNNTRHKRSVRVWGACARTEARVLTYSSKQSKDHRSKTLISQGGKLAEAAVVAAAIRKLWPTIRLKQALPLKLKAWSHLLVCPE